MKQTLFLIVLAAILIGCASDQAVAPQTGTITGVVRKASGSDVAPNAEISTVPITQALLTGPDGAFTITDVTPGEYVVNANYLDSAVASTAVNVKPGGISRADMLLKAGGTLPGIIRGVVADESGTVRQGIEIQTTPPTSQVRTNAQGAFTITNVSAGTYTVQVTSDSLFGSSSATVASGKSTDVSIVVRRLSPNRGNVSGRITNASSPVAGLVAGFDALVMFDTTTADGTYRLLNVPAGTFTFSLRRGDSVILTTSIIVKPGEESVYDVDLSQERKIPTEGLLLYLPFNNGTIDESPYRRPTKVLGGFLNVDRHGNLKGAFENDGNALNGIEIAHDQKLNPFSMTMGAWLYILGKTPKDGMILGKTVHPTGDGYYFMIENERLAVVYTADRFDNALRADFEFPMNTWFWVGMSVSSEGSGSGSANGIEKRLRSFGKPKSVTTMAPFIIGATDKSIATVRGLEGMIDKVVLYDRTMTMDELGQIMNTTD